MLEKWKETTEKIQERTAGIVGAVTEATEVAVDKVNHLLGDFNEAIPIIRALGLSVTDVRITMGLLPGVRAKLTGSVEALDGDKLKEHLTEKQQNRILTSILQSLRTVALFKDQLSEIGFKGVVIDLTIGIPPQMEVELLTEGRAEPLSVRT